MRTLPASIISDEYFSRAKRVDATASRSTRPSEPSRIFYAHAFGFEAAAAVGGGG